MFFYHAKNLGFLLVIFFWMQVSFPCNAEAGSKKSIGDRVVVEINNIVYTQRQLEVYITVKESLKSAQSSEIRFVNASSWPVFLEEFKQDMIIEQEAQRLASFNPTERMILKAEEIYRNKIENNIELREAMLKLDIDKNTLIRTIPSALRIEAFRRSKEKRTDELKEKEVASGLVSGPKQQWLIELEQRAVVRFFDGATSYEPVGFPVKAAASPDSGKK
jgi:hypothetical protein